MIDWNLQHIIYHCWIYTQTVEFCRIQWKINITVLLNIRILNI